MAGEDRQALIAKVRVRLARERLKDSPAHAAAQPADTERREGSAHRQVGHIERLVVVWAGSSQRHQLAFFDAGLCEEGLTITGVFGEQIGEKRSKPAATGVWW